MRQSSRARRHTFLKLPLILLLLILALGTCEDSGGDCGGGDCGGGDCGSDSTETSSSSGSGCDGGGGGCDDSSDPYDPYNSSGSCTGGPDYICYECGSSRPAPPPPALPPPTPQPGTNTLILVSAAIGGANGQSGHASLSNSASFVAFESTAANLAPPDANNASDVFLYSRVSGTVQLISRTAGGASGNGPSVGPSLSADADVLVFESAASDLVPSDPNGALSDLFVYHRTSTMLLRLGLSTDGFGPNAGVSEPQISADGSVVAFSSVSTNLIADDANGAVRDVFIVTLSSGDVELVSVSTDLNGANGPSSSPSLSSSGRYVVFESEASDLVPSDPNSAVSDIFLFDTQMQVMQLVSVSDEGDAADGASHAPTISPSGRFIAFHSVATTLDGTDLNGSVRDIYQADRYFGELVRITRSFSGGGANAGSGYPRYSTDGAFLVFESFASNLVSSDGNGILADAFIYEQFSKDMALVSVRDGQPGNGHSLMPAISPDGSYVGFESFAPDLHTLDLNGADEDVFLGRNPF